MQQLAQRLIDDYDISPNVVFEWGRIDPLVVVCGWSVTYEEDGRGWVIKEYIQSDDSDRDEDMRNQRRAEDLAAALNELQEGRRG